jgi:hypothetical protein
VDPVGGLVGAGLAGIQPGDHASMATTGASWAVHFFQVRPGMILASWR